MHQVEMIALLTMSGLSKKDKKAFGYRNLLLDASIDVHTDIRVYVYKVSEHPDEDVALKTLVETDNIIVISKTKVGCHDVADAMLSVFLRLKDSFDLMIESIHHDGNIQIAAMIAKAFKKEESVEDKDEEEEEEDDKTPGSESSDREAFRSFITNFVIPSIKKDRERRKSSRN